MMDLVLDDWQKEILEAKGDILLCKGRRIGATYIFALKAVEYLMKNKGAQIVCVSLVEDQAKLIIAFATNYATTKYKKYIGRGKDKPTLGSLTINRGKLLARPVGTTGDSVRGFNGHVLMVDEAPRQPKSMWQAAKPILLTTGGEIWMWGTPFGKEGYFWEKFDEAWNKKDPRARFKAFYHTSEEIMEKRPISESWTIHQREEALKILDEEKRDMSELEYGQEYLGLFMEDLMRWFSDEWIDEVCTEKPGSVGGDCSLGVDPARLGGDEIAFEILRMINRENIRHVYHEVQIKKLTTWTEDRIVDLDTMWNFRKIYLDAGAGTLGVSILDHLLRIGRTKRKVEALNSRRIVLDREGKRTQKLLNEDMYNNLRRLGERGYIKLLDNEKVRLSLRSIQYEIIREKGKASRFHIFSNYGHIVEALIRAAECVRDKTLNISIYYI